MTAKLYMRMLLLPILILIVSFSQAQIINVSVASGNNAACFGSPSANPNIQQFTASGSALTADITVTAPADFEISITSGSGYVSSLILTQAGGIVPNTIIYVRSAATAPVGAISGNVMLTSTGAATVNVAVSGTVNPIPTATANPTAQTICSGNAITTIINSGTVPGTVYNWVRNNTATVTGIAASGSGNINGILNNTTIAPVTVTFTITPSYTNAGVTCTGTAVIATVVVNPTPTVNAVASQVKCNGAASNAIVFSGNVAGTVYDWTNNDPSIGLAASGTGNIAPFTLTNVTTDPVTATITVTPSFTNAGTTCAGASTSFTISVNPTATVDAVADQVVCATALTSAINFSSPSAGFPASTIVYNWINTNAGIGLPGSGNGSITAFTATNNTTAPLIANITVTPTYTYNGLSCTGSPTTFSITVNPRATANAIANQSLCNGNATAAVNFSSTYTGGSIVYNWVNNDPSIGLAASGAGNIASFTGTNVTTAPVTATIMVTPTYTSNGVSCVGAASMFTITVNPTASVDPVADETLCANQVTTPIVFTGPVSGTIYNWVNNNPSIGLAASGTGNIPSFTTNNNLTNATAATITVRPTTANGCIGTAINFTITVNPIATVNAIADQVLCNNSSAAAINFSSTATGGTIVYNWTNSDPTIGIPASGSGNIGNFTATNTTLTPIIATITVTPTITNNGVSCTGISRTFTITVNPTVSVVATPNNQRVCYNSFVQPIIFTSPNSGGSIIYNWVNNNTSIGLPASGTGNTPGFIGNNTTNTSQLALITVTPTFINAGVACVGTPIQASIEVSPQLTVNQVSSQIVCNGASIANINFTNNVPPNMRAGFNWTNSNPAIGLAASGGGDIASFIATNTTSAPIVATISVIYVQESPACSSNPMTFTITVNPTATVNVVSDQTVCNNSSTTAINFSSPNSGNAGSNIVYNWINNTPAIGLAASGTGDIASFTGVNAGTIPLIATITEMPIYTNNGITCTGTVSSFTITVLPVMTVNTIPSQVLCNGSSSANINFSTPNSGGILSYTWDNDNPSIGLAAFGSGNINSFTAINTTSAPITANITVTPRFMSSDESVSCTGISQTFTITVNPTPSVNAGFFSQSHCANESTLPIVFSGPVAGTTFSWVNNNPSIGLAASGTGDIQSFVAQNTTNVEIFAVITVTPTYTNAGVSCTGTPISFQIRVGPEATVNPIPNMVLCNGASTSTILITGPIPDVDYYWYNDNRSIGLAGSGITSIPSFVATNNTTAPIEATIQIYPDHRNTGCVGIPYTFTITVNPTATVDSVANQTICANSSTTPIVFTSPNNSNVVFNWVNNTPSIGLAASGTGNIPSFIGINNTSTPLNATITVTPSYTNNGISCDGLPRSFTITVNPSGTVSPVANQSLCNNNTTAAINFTTGNTNGTTVYNWVNNTPSIGLAASGSGNIASFTATNNTNASVTAIITVTPTFTNGAVSCVGTSTTFTITVHPTAQVSAVPDQVLCANEVTAPIVFVSTVSGTTYTWVNNNTSIGLTASGSGNIPSFVTANNLTNAITATITVTPSTGNGCTGAPIGFTITVNPIATVNPVANQVLCNGSSTAAIVFSSAATGGTIIYDWVNSDPSIGIAASGSGNIPTFVATNNTTAPVVATITVTPTFTNNGVSCVGIPLTFTITVNPTATVNAVANQVLCNGSSTTAIAFISPNSGNGGSNVVFNWVNNNTGIGLAASGAGNIPSFTVTNNSTALVVATITVTPTYTNAGVSCVGTDITFTITVNPTATVNTIANQSLCNNNATAAVNFSSVYTGGTIVYNWTNNTPSIGLAASGAGNIASFIATNATNLPVTATITVTPIFTNAGVSCVGTSSTFTITVNPTATINAVANQILCANQTTVPIVFNSPVSGTTYSWVNNNPSIGLAASGTGDIPSFVTSNTLTNATTATITVTPSVISGCTGAPITFTITVNPIATINTVANQVLCNGSSTAAINFSSPATGGTIIYDWVNSDPSIGIAASGSGNIPTFVATNNTTTPVVATITVTPTFTNNGVSCVGIPFTFTITVNPTATVNAVANQVLCNASSTTTIIFTSPNSGNGGSNVVFNWANNNTSIGLAASGAGNIPSFTATNNTNAPAVATITVTPTFTNAGVSCVGTDITFNITVNPTATVNTITNQSLCNNVATAAVNFSSIYTGGTVVYNWINNTPSIGLAASGAGNIASFIATNATNLPVTATITVTPIFTNAGVSCVGTSSTFTITVNPTAVVNAVASQSLCANTTTVPIVFSSPVSGTTYTWVNNNPAIGLVASGVGNIPSFVTTNNLNSINATIAVTPNSPFGCTGLPITFVITVNPITTVNAVNNQIRCNGILTDSIKFSSPNGTNGGGTIVYNWTNTAPSIGIPATGSGNINPFTATNTGSVPVIAIITVTPSFVNGSSNCVGIPITFSITVNPTAVVNAIASQTVCAGQPTAAVNFAGAVSGTSFSWVNTNTAIGLATSGTGNIASFIAQNNTSNTIMATITITPNTLAGCIGASRSFDIIVQALSVAPTAISTPALLLCDTNTVTTLRVTGGALGTGAVWRWYKDACGGTPFATGEVVNNVTVSNTTTFYVRAEGTCNTTTCASVTIQVAKLVTHVRQHWGDVLFFDNSSRNFVAWQWYKNGVAVPGATLQNYSESTALNGQYYAEATDINGNKFLTCPLFLTTNGFHGIELKAIPNPVPQGQAFKVQISLTPVQLQGAVITVSNLLGTAISQHNSVTPITGMQAPFASGTYIVSLVLRNGQRYSVTLLVN